MDNLSPKDSSNKNQPNLQPEQPTEKQGWFFSRHWLWKLVVVVVIFVALSFVGVYAYNNYYEERVLPGISVGKAPISGMNKTELKDFLNRMNDKLANDGMVFNYEIGQEKKSITIYPFVDNQSSAPDLISIDAEAEAERLINYGKDQNFLFNTWKILQLHLNAEPLVLQNVQIAEERLQAKLKESLSSFQPQPIDAGIKIVSISPLVYEITSSSPGVVFDYIQAIGEVKKNWSNLQEKSVMVLKKQQTATVNETDVESIVNRLPKVFTAGDLVLNYTEPQTGRIFNWRLDGNKIKNWLEVQKVSGNGFGFGLNKQLVVDFLKKNVADKINVEALNAKFKMDEASGRVTEFQASRPGIVLNLPESYKQINDAILDRTWHDEGLIKSITLVVSKTEPAIKTGDVNSLGIKEILGVGISDYSNSPTNRKKNIANAVKKLNGLLIKPGEIFSTLKFTGPFTLEGGYFPELVIKGDRIKPEVGGGLCQIGTTLFRMSMNSAMEILQRQNHSLVINHYLDPVNNLPGTDATVYDPAPDFKFKNDTGNYVLIQTFMDKKNEELVFTLWGSADGRQGSYTHPVVKQWLPVGEPKEIETTDLAPGKKECQNAFRGADASFTYTRILADGIKQEKVFESHYRPLPKICLVGVVSSTPAVGGTVITSSTEVIGTVEG